MKTNRKSVSTVVVAAVVVIVLIVGVLGGYMAGTVTKSGVTHTSTVTTTLPTTVTTTVPTTVGSTVTSTVTTTTTATTTLAMAPLISFSADAYATETTALLNAFSKSTGVPVAPVTSGGSFADANKIAAGAPDDVFVSVALSATSKQYLKSLTSNWTVGFASDQMVLAYANSTSPPSSVANVVQLANTAETSNATSDWNAFFASLVSGNVKVGIANPNSDPAGLRGWLVLEAAGFLYAKGNQSAYSKVILNDNGFVNGTNAAALVAPLQSGQIQFLFIYKSAAKSDGLLYISLDRHVNLGDPTLGTYYSQFTYTDSAGLNKGAAIILCVTIPLSCVNTAEALEFVQYVIKNAGTLSSYGLQPFSPARLYSDVTPPAPIEALLTQGVLIQAGTL